MYSVGDSAGRSDATHRTVKGTWEEEEEEEEEEEDVPLPNAVALVSGFKGAPGVVVLLPSTRPSAAVSRNQTAQGTENGASIEEART